MTQQQKKNYSALDIVHVHSQAPHIIEHITRALLKLSEAKTKKKVFHKQVSPLEH